MYTCVWLNTQWRTGGWVWFSLRLCFFFVALLSSRNLSSNASRYPGQTLFDFWHRIHPGFPSSHYFWSAEFQYCMLIGVRTVIEQVLSTKTRSKYLYSSCGFISNFYNINVIGIAYSHGTYSILLTACLCWPFFPPDYHKKSSWVNIAVRRFFKWKSSTENIAQNKTSTLMSTTVWVRIKMTQPISNHMRPKTNSKASVKFQKKLFRFCLAERSGQDCSIKIGWIWNG